MNQQCKVCGEPAAGFHFGAFTCEGCKSFFGRSYNNISSISDCKNNGECIINKKNRTSCKACRLRKCLMVGMSKSGSRYGRRSNWFKIHCLLQEQQQQSSHRQQKTPPPIAHPALSVLGHPAQQMDPRLHHQLAAAMSHHQAMQGRTKEDLMLLGLDEYKNSTSPSISSPESHNSDTSVEVSESRLLAGGGLFLNNNSIKYSPDQHTQRPGSNGIIGKDMFNPLHIASLASIPMFPPSAAFLPPPAAFNGMAPQHSAFLFSPGSYLYQQQQLKTPQSLLKNNNNRYTHNNNDSLGHGDMYSKRFILDAILQSQISPSRSSPNRDEEDDEDNDEEETRTEETSSPKHKSNITFNTHNRKTVPMSLSISPQDNDSIQENPMDLSMKGCRRASRNDDDRRSLSGGSVDDEITDNEEEMDGDIDVQDIEDDAEFDTRSIGSDHKEQHSLNVVPIDLTTRA